MLFMTQDRINDMYNRLGGGVAYMTLTEAYYRKIFDELISEEPYKGESIKEVQDRAAATYFCFGLYLINKVFCKSLSIQYFEGVAEDIVQSVLGIKKRPYKFKVENREYCIQIQETILREAYYIWALGYKFLRFTGREDVDVGFRWFNYWREQIGRYENENK